MKYSIVFSAFVATAAAVKPAFLNSNFDVQEGQPFTLKFSGCPTTCSIILENGPTGNLKDVKTLDSSASGGSATVTLSGLPSANYAFKIVDNGTGESNFSTDFPFQGTGSASSSDTSTPSSTPASTPSSTPSSTTTTVSVTQSTTTSSTTVTSTTTQSSSTSSSNSTTSASSTTSSSPTPATTTTVPGAAGRIASPIALVVGAVAAMAIFN